MDILDNHSNYQMGEATFESVKQAWQKSSGWYDNLGFYMAKTDIAGRHEISGTCAGSFSSLFVYGDGYQPASRRQLFSGDEHTSPALNFIGLSSSRNFSEGMFTGSTELKPVVLARQAILKIGPDGGPSTQRKSYRYLRAPLLGSEPGTWDLKVKQEGGKTVFTVPAEIPFDIVWAAEGKYSLSIKTPFKPVKYVILVSRSGCVRNSRSNSLRNKSSLWTKRQQTVRRKWMTGSHEITHTPVNATESMGPEERVLEFTRWARP